VLDGDGPSSGVALLDVIRQILERGAAHSAYSLAPLAGYARPALVNTRGVVTGELRPAGGLQFFDA